MRKYQTSKLGMRVDPKVICEMPRLPCNDNFWTVIYVHDLAITIRNSEASSSEFLENVSLCEVFDWPIK